MSRRAVQLLLSLPEKLRFVRGLRAWLGLPRSRFPFRARHVQLAIRSIRLANC